MPELEPPLIPTSIDFTNYTNRPRLAKTFVHYYGGGIWGVTANSLIDGRRQSRIATFRTEAQAKLFQEKLEQAFQQSI